MPFLDHLEELRWRLVWSVGALAVAFTFTFWFCMNHDVISFLITPIKPYLHGKALIVTHPVEKFGIIMKIAAGIAVVLASPVIIYQVWTFLSPALKPKEKKVIVPVLVFAALLFLAGVAMSVFIFVPVTMMLMDQIKTDAIENLYTAGEYFGFLFSVSLAFGALFEVPIVILALTALGLLTPKLLTRYRRHAFVGLLVVCAIITPGDAIVSTLMLFVPVYGLYEASILVSWFVYRARLKREARAVAVSAQATA